MTRKIDMSGVTDETRPIDLERCAKYLVDAINNAYDRIGIDLNGGGPNGLENAAEPIAREFIMLASCDYATVSMLEKLKVKHDKINEEFYAVQKKYWDDKRGQQQED